jgi:hypothetical protein
MTATLTNNPKKDTINTLLSAVGDGNVSVYFQHLYTNLDRFTRLVSYRFKVNGVTFQTGLYDAEEYDFPVNVNEYLVSTGEISLVLWYLGQPDTVAV